MTDLETSKCFRCGALRELVIFNPCGHQTLCIECRTQYSNDIPKCHLCNSPVDHIIWPEPIQALLSLSEMKPSDNQDKTIDCGVCTSLCKPVMLFPCGHNSFCAACVGSLDSLDCPLCRQNITSVKEQGKEALKAEIFQSERKKVVLHELEKTMQIIMFGVNSPETLKINTVQDDEKRSKFSPNWICDGDQMNILFASISVHGNNNLITSLSPDIFVIVQNKMSDQSYQEFCKIHARLEKVMENESSIPILWLITDEDCCYVVYKNHHDSFVMLKNNDPLGGLRINMGTENGEKALFQELFRICNEYWESL